MENKFFEREPRKLIRDPKNISRHEYQPRVSKPSKTKANKEKDIFKNEDQSDELYADTEEKK